MRKRPKVCMLVLNDVTSDPRVTREAKALVEDGHEVVVVGVYSDANPALAETVEDGYSIYRVKRSDPVQISLTPRGAADRLRETLLKGLRAIDPERYVELRDRYLDLRYGGELPPHVELRDGVLHSLAPEPEPSEGEDDAPEEAPPELPSGPSTMLSKDVGEIVDVLRWNLQLARAAAQERASVYHAHDLDMLLAGCFAKAMNRAKLVFDAHEIYDLQVKPSLRSRTWRAWYRGLQRVLPRYADRRVTVSNGLARWLSKEAGFTSWDVLRNIPEAPADVFEAPAPKDPALALYHGRLFHGRGLETLIRAAKYLEPGLRIGLRGSGPPEYEASLRQLVREEGVEDRVEFLPFVPMRDLVKTASTAGLGLVPILPTCMNHYYCLPNKCFEYLAAGLPLLCSDLPELRLLLAKHDVGEVVDFGHPPSIAAGINRLLGNPELREALSERARALGEGECSWREERQVLRSIYDQLESGFA